MAILEPRCALPGFELDNAREDYRTARRAAQYRVSEKALYYPAFPANQYIPFAALTQVVVRKASLPTTGCCGKELPVIKVILRWEGGQQELVVDPPRHADTMVEHIRAARPDLTVEDRR